MDERRLLLCRLIVSGMPKAQAGVEAGYSPRTAASIVSRVLKEPRVKAEITRLRKERDEKMESDDERKLKAHYDTPLDLFMDVMNNPKLPFSVRTYAAKQAMPYIHGKPASKGKKNDIKETARELADGGKFTPGRKPNLRAVN